MTTPTTRPTPTPARAGAGITWNTTRTHAGGTNYWHRQCPNCFDATGVRIAARRPSCTHTA
jgi:hypothetical protein